MKKRTEQPATFRTTAELRALYRAEDKVKKSGLGRVIASRVLTEENSRKSKITITRWSAAPSRGRLLDLSIPYRRNRRIRHSLRSRYRRTSIPHPGSEWDQVVPRTDRATLHLAWRRPRNPSAGSNGLRQDLRAARRQSDRAGVKTRTGWETASSQG
jgi:hypothetical protein